MSAHRVFIVALFSVVLVAMSVFAVRSLLFAQENWQICVQGPYRITVDENEQILYDENKNPKSKIYTVIVTTIHFDDTCESYSAPQPLCIRIVQSPKAVSVGQKSLYEWRNGGWVFVRTVDAVESAGTYKVC